jgi:putative tricarboxylic transport membrane protein
LLALATIAGALAYLYADLQLTHLNVSDPVGPAMFPGLVGGGLLLSGLLLLWETRKPRAAPIGEATPHHVFERQPVLVLLAMAVWTAAYYYAFERLGYLTATVLYIFPMLAFFNRGRWLTNILVSAGFAVAAYVVFAKFLRVPMPAGILAF